MSFWLQRGLKHQLVLLLNGFFGAFAEEYRVLEDGCGHLLPILRGVGGLRG